jgi:hypothetical protein
MTEVLEVNSQNKDLDGMLPPPGVFRSFSTNPNDSP